MRRSQNVLPLAYTLVAVRMGGVPAARDFFGHSLGVLGILLMLMTETLYTLRKRSRAARWGRIANWLQFHIFTGIVGPFLVLLHTSWKFNGLAGIVMLMTAIVVASGFIGRYLYTNLPRTADGEILEARELERQIQQIEAELRARVAGAQGAINPAEEAEAGQPSGGIPLGFIFSPLQSFHAWRQRRHMDPQARRQAKQMDEYIRRRDRLRRQVASLANARRAMSIWHSVHIPLGVSLFTAAFFHAGAAIYYATLLK
jgi:hypothetical protein